MMGGEFLFNLFIKFSGCRKTGFEAHGCPNLNIIIKLLYAFHTSRIHEICTGRESATLMTQGKKEKKEKEKRKSA